MKAGETGAERSQGNKQPNANQENILRAYADEPNAAAVSRRLGPSGTSAV